ncbi:MAG TPA: hypothetical protein VF026_31220 [Ktedonobacteraceae bacterium]
MRIISYSLRIAWVVGIGLDPLIGGTGDPGLTMTGISSGSGLMLLAFMVRAFI